jgi:hypothetical protein
MSSVDIIFLTFASLAHAHSHSSLTQHRCTECGWQDARTWHGREGPPLPRRDWFGKYPLACRRECVRGCNMLCVACCVCVCVVCVCESKCGVRITGLIKGVSSFRNSRMSQWTMRSSRRCSHRDRSRVASSRFVPSPFHPHIPDCYGWTDPTTHPPFVPPSRVVGCSTTHPMLCSPLN